MFWCGRCCVIVRITFDLIFLCSYNRRTTCRRYRANTTGEAVSNTRTRTAKPSVRASARTPHHHAETDRCKLRHHETTKKHRVLLKQAVSQKGHGTRMRKFLLRNTHTINRALKSGTASCVYKGVGTTHLSVYLVSRK